MGYQVYEDRYAIDYGVKRWAGYGVPAICDVAGCSRAIDRGMGYRCVEYTEYRYLDGDGNEVSGDDPDWEEELEEEREGCYLHFCGEHEEHWVHGDDVVPKPDTAEWIEWMLTDESWEDWRTSESDEYAAKQKELAALRGEA